MVRYRPKQIEVYYKIMKIPEDEHNQESHEWMHEVEKEVERAMVECHGNYCRVVVTKVIT